MSLFVNLRHINTSVTNLSEMVDKISNEMTKDTHNSRVETERPRIYGSSLFKPTLGLGVKFSQSQEDVHNAMPSSRLRSHMSLPNLDKDDSFEKVKLGYCNKPIITEEEDSKGKQSTTVHISSENLSDWIVATTRKRPHFDDQGATHPMDFIEDVKYFVSELKISPDKQLLFIISCLEGIPLMWARCFRGEFQDVDSFFAAFEQEYWGADRQKSVLYDMKLGKYDDANPSMSMSEYFLHKVSNYRHLTPAPSDLEIVYSLAAHFPTAVELELRLKQKPSLRDAYRVLRRREGEAADFVPNYLFEMCEAFQRGQRPESARTQEPREGPISARTECSRKY